MDLSSLSLLYRVIGSIINIRKSTVSSEDKEEADCIQDLWESYWWYGNC